MSDFNPLADLVPGQTMMVDGYDWAWCFVCFQSIPACNGVRCVGYTAGSNGTIWVDKVVKCKKYRDNSPRYRIKKVYPDMRGYLRTKIRCVDGKSRLGYVNSLVLSAFFGKKPDEMVCCHNNGKNYDNNLFNLRWDTVLGNLNDKLIHGTEKIFLPGEGSPLSRLTDSIVLEIRNMHSIGYKNMEISKSLELVILILLG